MHVSSVNVQHLITELQQDSYNPEVTVPNTRDMATCLSTLEREAQFQITRGLWAATLD